MTMKALTKKLLRDLWCLLGFHDYQGTRICQHCSHEKKKRPTRARP